MSTHQWSWKLLRAGALRLDGGSMFGIIPRTFWSKWTESDERNRIPLQANCLLLDDGESKVLVETGCGSKWSDKERSIYALEDRTVVDALSEIGVEPRDISTVIVTHLHFDHAGGLTTLNDDGEPTSVFSSARIVVQKQEWEDALANRSTMSRTYLRSHLDPIREQVDLVDGPSDILPGIQVEPLPGHTWGMQGVFIQDERGMVVFPGDLMPTVAHVHPSASMAYDMLPYTSMESKAAFLARAADEGWRLVLDHEPGNPCVGVDRTEPGHFALHSISEKERGD